MGDKAHQQVNCCLFLEDLPASHIEGYLPPLSLQLDIQLTSLWYL